MVPIGVHQKEIKVARESEIERRSLVMVSTLFPSKGVQLAIAALEYLPEAHLTIIGTGPYALELRNIAHGHGVLDRVEFTGMLNREELFARLSRSRIAIATYHTDPANYSYYADPAKPKEYLACGIPVIITRVPWIAEAIEAKPMGLAIDYDARQLAQACKKLMEDDEFWSRCRREALQFSRNLDWDLIFDRAFDNLEKTICLPKRI